MKSDSLSEYSSSGISLSFFSSKMTLLYTGRIMEPLKELKDVINVLPRGGYLIDTPSGYLQFGAPPETIKDTVMLPKGVPLIFVLPREFFNWIKGISVAELEFPIYYNFFLKKKKTRIICDVEQAGKLTRVLQESLFGPYEWNIASDFYGDSDIAKDIKNEMKFFKTMEMTDVVEFCIFKKGACLIDGIKIEQHKNNNYDVYYENSFLAHVPCAVDYKPRYLIGERLNEPFIPPLFAMTCLGPSNGFDPYDNTSGFIMWLNHMGVMIDPPVNSTEWLLDSNVSPKFIDSIILTHCHADHDAGTFQKILEEGKVTIYTTETIMMSFLRKYANLTNSSVEYLMSLFDFHPVKIGKPVFIHGARFDMFYSLHSIPAIGFRMEFQEKSITYSSDHNSNPELHEKLFKEKIISEKRYAMLKNFPWDSTVVFHESGFPPLHTPISHMVNMPEEIKKKIVIYHISKKEMVKDDSLRLAKFGMENTIYFDVLPPSFEKTNQIMGLLYYFDIFNDITVKKAQEFLNIVKEERFKKDDIIIKSDTFGDKFYVIYSGNVLIKSEDGKYSKLYGSYDYFGEIALLTGRKRTANVYAATDVTLYSIEKEKFLNFIIGTQYEKMLMHLVEVRDEEAWEILSSSRFMMFFTSTQRLVLESMLIPITFNDPGTLIKEGDKMERLFIVRDGLVKVEKASEMIAILQRGDIVGSVLDIYENNKSSFSFVNDQPITLYYITRDNLVKYFNLNPGLIMKINYVFTQYMFINN